VPFHIVDRYVFFVFLRVFLICCVCLTGIYVVGDLVENLNEFIDAGAQSGGMMPLLSKYYAGRVPWFFDVIGRVAALVAGVFAITWLQRNNEMTALMAAGISRWRIIKPIVVGVILISIASALNRELLIPRFREDLSQTIRESSGGQGSPVAPQYDYLTDILIDGQQIVARDKRIVRPMFRLPSSMSYFAHQLTADQAVRLPATPEHPSGFLLVNVQNPVDIDRLDAVHLDGRPVIYTVSTASWLKPGQCFVVSHVSFGQLLGGKSWRQFASTADLISGLNNPSMNFGADVRVSVHARIIQPLLDIALFFLGIPTVLARESRNMFVAAGSCVLIVAAYFLIVLSSHNLGMNYLISPVQAAWAPAMIMVPWAVFRSGVLRT
jgi:lipopolysaccharide export system permease protein